MKKAQYELVESFFRDLFIEINVDTPCGCILEG